MDRPQTAEMGPGQIEVQHRKGKLPGDDDADQEADEAPEDRGDHTGPYDTVVVGLLDRRNAPFALVEGLDVDRAGAAAADQEDQPTVELHDGIVGETCEQDTQGRPQREAAKGKPVAQGLTYRYSRHG